ncbi:MAG TPA: glycosyltransferase family 39 protein [Patescibacteria group bacterium]|nr:glycosyltransferase family 39 protein [Patescibacteria group bacterium]
MFSLAFLIGIYSFLIFGLGLVGLLYKENVQILTLAYVLLLIVFFRRKILKFRPKLKLNLPLALILLLILVNLVGALGPELGFDALWYHLTLPKIYLINHKIFHIPGGLFYYSDMPKLVEMLYVGALTFGGEVMAKLIHLLFGVLSTIVVYKISRKVLNEKLSFLSSLIFYSSLAIGWMSITSYIDLGRTFFEAMALLGFLNFIETKRKSWLIESSFMLGLAISSKLLSLGSIVIFLVLLLIGVEKRNYKNILSFAFIPLFVALPWFIFSLLNTGNPVYPFFTDIYKTGFDLSLINPIRLITDVFNLFVRSQDPINPSFIIFIPFLFFYLTKLDKLTKLIFIYSLISVFVWYVTPRTGGGRFILPLLPALSVLTVKSIEILSKDKAISRVAYILVISISILSILYRGVANSKYLREILGRESKAEFLSDNLNFRYGDFYDTDGFFKKTISPKDTVLLYGFHNLYYVDFPFIDSSYVKVGDKFDFIATQNSDLPERFKFWKEIYSNPKTGVKLYSFQGKIWLY